MRTLSRWLLAFLLLTMADSNPIIVGGGIQSGTPFTLGRLVYVTNVNPPQLTSYGPQVALDGVVQYTDVPDSAGTYTGLGGAVETFRIQGGAIIQGGGTDSVAIGRGAAAAIASGANGADTIAIGRGIIGGTVTTQKVAIGALANISGGASVVVGYNSGSGSANAVAGIFIGNQAQASGNAGGATVVVIGDGALIVLGNAGGGGGVAIGFAATVNHPGSVTIGRSAQSSGSSTSSQNTVTVGDGATSTRFGTTVVGGGASTTQFTSTVVGSGASVTLNAASPSVGSIVIGQTATTSKAGCVVIGTASALTSTASACIGHGCADMGANVIQLGGPNSAYNVIVLGQGDTVGSPAAKGFRFTNGSGTDNAAGDITWQAPLSTGAAMPARHIFTVGEPHGSDGVVQTPFNGLVLDASTTADDIRMLVYDVTAAASVRVSRGAAGSGGVGFRLLRVPN